MIQKYDENQLFKLFKKIAGTYISELQDEIGAYLKSQDKYIQNSFFASMPDFMKDIEYKGYSIHQNKSIGISVYYFDSSYEDIAKAQQKIVSIIKNKKMPFKFTVYIDPETEGAIELCIDIEDLTKLDNTTSRKKSISYLDACDIIEHILTDNKRSIQSDLNRVINKYKISDICEIDTEFGTGHYSSHSDYEKYIDISLVLFNYNLYNIRDTNSKEFIRLIERVLREIESIMKRYIKFKFSVDTDLRTIGISVEYDSVKNHKDALNFIREETSIFDKIEFL